jgi:hypothetical protein
MIRKRTALALFFFAALTANAQSKVTYRVQRNRLAVAKPECAKGAICFFGEVAGGREFRKAVNADLNFVLALPGSIDVVPRQPDPACHLEQWIANPPLTAHHPTEIDAAYDWTAAQEVSDSPREFQIVQNCREFQSLYGPCTGNRRTRTQINIFDTPDDDYGAIEWLKFSVKIILSTKPAAASPPQPKSPNTH